MAELEPARGPRGVRVIGVLIIIAGVILLGAGVATWFTVRDQLSDEKITVSEDADRFAGEKVDDPFTAYSEANTIEKHALEASGGQTYAELPQDDPRRETVMTASFLRASLFTSVVAFGVAALAAGLGVVFILLGWALLAIAKAGRRAAAVAAAAPGAASVAVAAAPAAVTERAAEPVTERAAEPVTERAAEPMPEQAAEPMPERAEPMPERAAEPPPETASERAPEPPAESPTEPRTEPEP